MPTLIGTKVLYGFGTQIFKKNINLVCKFKKTIIFAIQTVILVLDLVFKFKKHKKAICIKKNILLERKMHMYLKDKTKQLTIRFSEDQINYIEKIAKDLGITKASTIRMLVLKNMPLYILEENTKNTQKEVDKNDNEFTDIDNFV